MLKKKDFFEVGFEIWLQAEEHNFLPVYCSTCHSTYSPARVGLLRLKEGHLESNNKWRQLGCGMQLYFTSFFHCSTRFWLNISLFTRAPFLSRFHFALFSAPCLIQNLLLLHVSVTFPRACIPQIFANGYSHRTCLICQWSRRMEIEVLKLRTHYILGQLATTRPNLQQLP